MRYAALLSLLILSLPLYPQVTTDTSFTLEFEPKYEQNSGPCVCIDSGHNNLHTAETNFKPFARLLEQDGYKIKNLNRKFTRASDLEDCRILVISNALHSSNLQNWQLPTPSAFTESEVEILNNWVKTGGSLWLIADHMPFAGAANGLAQSFGFEYSNGFAQLAEKTNAVEQFSMANERLQEHLVTTEIPFVVSFTGSAFTYPKDSELLLTFTEQDVSREPDVAWEFNDNTHLISMKDYAQGALLNYGQGKIAVFGEAAMFTAQLAPGEFKVGFNSPKAPHNASFCLNLAHWLDRGGTSTSPAQTAQDIILQRLRSMEETFHSEKYEDLAIFYSDSAVVTGKSVEISGRSAIRQYWKSLDGRGHSWELENIVIIKLGEAYLQRGISRMSFRNGDQIVKADSKFSLIWIKEDGNWVILLDHFSPLQ